MHTSQGRIETDREVATDDDEEEDEEEDEEGEGERESDHERSAGASGHGWHCLFCGPRLTGSSCNAFIFERTYGRFTHTARSRPTVLGKLPELHQQCRVHLPPAWSRSGLDLLKDSR